MIITKDNPKEIILNNKTGTPLIADKLTILKRAFKQRLLKGIL